MTLPVALEEVRKAPGMFLGSISYEAAVAFLNGYDIALAGGPLCGFREWLVLRVGGGNNLGWSGLVKELLGEAGLVKRKQTLEGQKIAIEFLFSLLEEFMTERDEHGVRRVYVAYEQWLREQSWYREGMK
jgi:hypothetical protein